MEQSALSRGEGTWWCSGPGSGSRGVMLYFWIQSRFLGGKHPSIMLALDRSQSTYDITNSSFPARLYLEWMQGGELCNVGRNNGHEAPCACVAGWAPIPEPMGSLPCSQSVLRWEAAQSLIRVLRTLQFLLTPGTLVFILLLGGCL